MSDLLLKIAASRLRAVIHSLNSAVLVEDENRRIVLVNQLFCDLFRIPALPDALVGEDCSRSAEQAMNFTADPGAFLSRIHALLGALQPAFNDRIELRDGRSLERDYIPIFAEDRFVGHLWHYRDVTAARRHAEALERGAEEARQANLAKDAFLAAVSHELRSPLNAILGSTELLRERARDQDSAELLRAVHQSARGLMSLINDILDLSSLRSGAFSLHPAPCDLTGLLDDILAAFRPGAASRGLQLLSRIPPDLPPSVRVDRQRLGQIITNLMANALRYTDTGAISLLAQHSPTGDRQIALHIEIQDTGIGVPERERASLFRPFHQAADAHHRRGGTGLGLTISNHLAQQMGGSLGYTPNNPAGSRFWLDLPLEILSEPIPRASSLHSMPAVAATPRRILVIEDNQANQIWARYALSSRGYLVEIADSGAQALRRLQEPPAFDAILTDWHMPIMDGLETTRAIRALGGALATLPILGLSASALPDAVQRCIDAGMDDCLLKPVSVRALADRLEKLLQRRAEAASIPPGTHAPTSWVVSIEGIPQDVCLELAQLFHDHTLERCGLLDLAGRQQNLDAIAQHAHAIASSAFGIQQIPLAEQARTLELHARQATPLHELLDESKNLQQACLQLAPLILESTRKAAGLASLPVPMEDPSMELPPHQPGSPCRGETSPKIKNPSCKEGSPKLAQRALNPWRSRRSAAHSSPDGSI